jgi:hypothetical protein
MKGKLLTKLRITSKETLKHDFFKEYDEENAYTSPTPPPPNTIANLNLSPRKVFATKMDHISQPSGPFKSTQENKPMVQLKSTQENKPMVQLKKTVKIMEPEKFQEHVPKQPPRYITPAHHKNPSPTSKIALYDTSENEPVKIFGNSTIHPRKSSMKASIPEPKMPIAMRRRVTKDYMPSYTKRPSLPKVRKVLTVVACPQNRSQTFASE